MNRPSEPRPPQPAAEEEARCLQALEDYQQALEAQQWERCRQLQQEHPELASEFRSLEVLYRLCEQQPAEPLSSGPDGPQQAPSVEQPPAGSPEGELPVERIGPYRLLERVGRGGMGVVYRAYQENLDRTVALKMLAPGRTGRDYLERFRQEVRAMAGLSHPHVVAVFDAGEVLGRPYLVMEFVEGQTLQEYMEQHGPLEPEQAARLVAQVAQAVEFLHQKGLLHRDLKPSNILLDSSGHVRVTDFGLAAVLERGQARDGGVLAGTPAYMAPEQIDPQHAPVDQRSDVYGLGALLYALLTGQPPVQGQDLWETLARVGRWEPRLPSELAPGVPQELEQVCMKCLEKHPQDRYLSARAVAEELQRFLQGEPVEAEPWGWLDRLWRAARREPALAARWVGVGGFFLAELVPLALGHVEPLVQAFITAVTALWLLSAWAFHRWHRRRPEAWDVPLWWSVSEVGLLTLLLLPIGAAANPMIVAYLVLVVASALWERVRLVWATAAASALGYAVLVAWFVIAGGGPRQMDPSWDRYLYFLMALLVTAALVAYQVQRYKSLRRFCQGG